jgi:hypothetical protein
MLMLACCIFAYLDPFDWRFSVGPPKPIKIVPLGEIAVVDVIELNHRPLLPSEQTRPGTPFSFDQLLFWSYYPDGELHIREWRLVKKRSMLPKRQKGRWVCTLDYGDVVQCVHAPSFRETTAFTPNDPELVDRKFVPKRERVPLWREPSPAQLRR